MEQFEGLLESIQDIFTSQIFIVVAVGLLLVYNILVFCMFRLDKQRAKKRMYRQRISEKNLLLLSFFGGSVGGILGMLINRHKTKKIKFKVLLPTFLVIHIVILVLFC